MTERRLTPLAAGVLEDGEQLPPARLPRGPHRLSRRVVADSQHARLIEAMAACVAARGYEAVTVADVVATAGVSRKTFYEHFRGKQDCFLAAYEAIDQVVTLVEERVEAAGPDPRARLEEGIGQFLELMGAVPDFARAFTIDVMAAGPELLDRRAAVIERLADMLGKIAADSGRDPSPELLRAVIGGIYELVIDALRRERADELSRLTPVAVELGAAVCLD